MIYKSRLLRGSFWPNSIYRCATLKAKVRPRKRLQAAATFWGLQYEYEINEWIQYLVSPMSPFSNANPIFAVKWSRVVRTFDSTSPSKSHFGWETTRCGSMALKFDYLRVLLVGSAAVGTFSFHAPDLCDSRWPADGSHRHPSRHQYCGQARQNRGQDTKDYHSWIW